MLWFILIREVKRPMLNGGIRTKIVMVYLNITKVLSIIGEGIRTKIVMVYQDTIKKLKSYPICIRTKIVMVYLS